MCLQDQAFFTLVNRVLCKNPQSAEFINDFQDLLANAIFTVLTKYMSCFAAPGSEFKPMDTTTARVLLNTLIDEQLLLTSEVDPAVELFVECMQMDVGQISTIARNGFGHWLKKRRMKWMVDHQTQAEDWDPHQLTEDIQRSLEALNITGEPKKYGRSFDSGFDVKDFDVERYSSGLRSLDKALGGGFGRKEFTLFIAGTGAGKTVMACQLGLQFALQGKKGVIITTEQPHDQLVVRIASNYCNVPFEQIKDGLKEERLSADQMPKYAEMRIAIGQRLFFENWLEDRSKSIITDLDNYIRGFIGEHEKIDFLILDWIGGALGSMNHTDVAAIRHTYQFTADKLSDLAIAHNIPTIGFAQAHPQQAANKRNIDSTMMSECKSMGRNATNIIGISALIDNERSDENVPIYQTDQFFWVSKARKSSGGQVRFRRRFAFQRIEER